MALGGSLREEASGEIGVNHVGGFRKFAHGSINIIGFGVVWLLLWHKWFLLLDCVLDAFSGKLIFFKLGQDVPEMLRMILEGAFARPLL